MKLNIYQLTLAKLAQLDRHQSGSQDIQVQSLLEVPFLLFLLKLHCISLRKQYENDNIANFVYLRENSTGILLMTWFRRKTVDE